MGPWLRVKRVVARGRSWSLVRSTCDAHLGLAVESDEVGDIQLLLPVECLWRHVTQVRDQHAELRAPVAYVVEAQHGVAAQVEDAAEAIADDRRAEMTDMHLLCDVRRRVCDGARHGRVSMHGATRSMVCREM